MTFLSKSSLDSMEVSDLVDFDPDQSFYFNATENINPLMDQWGSTVPDYGPQPVAVPSQSSITPLSVPSYSNLTSVTDSISKEHFIIL